MNDIAYARLMARYNAWQNAQAVKAAARLDEAALRRDRGAFFGSIQRTFSHLLWADLLWLSRFRGVPPPPGDLATSPDLYPDWDGFRTERAACDRALCDWADGLDPDWPRGMLGWRSSVDGTEVTRARSLLIVQLFNHQTHHRGQIHAMLTAAGVDPGPTDLQYMPGSDAPP